MQRLIEKIIIGLLCFLIQVLHFDITTCVIALLSTIIISNLSYYTDKGRTAMFLACGISILGIFMPGIALLLPVICYDCADRKLSFTQKIVSYLFIGLACVNTFHVLPFVFFGLLLVLAILGLFTGLKRQQIENLQKTILKNRDADRELQLLLEHKNADLIEKSHYEIEMATLRERNRIAREIHDNVGHLLTRSILQMGALKTINKSKDLAPHFEQISDTLNHAMDTIRASVHNLYNPEINLKSSIESFIETIEGPRIHLHYEVQQIPQTITFHFLAIIKEAVNNTLRHSNADTIHITLMEHPRFYQLTIEDNGNTITTKAHLQDTTQDALTKINSTGMGLSSMQERISSLNGTMKIFTNHGFKIFITVMKKENEQ